eukprot:GEMP01016185.1.p1 GENE.GEMP01016185.1~~GEMP01016185.1.p1  ORF type:complete len:826 (+),score=194.79 GEMP01016185.1:66-2543(+)
MERFRSNPYEKLMDVDRCIDIVMRQCAPCVAEGATEDAHFLATACDITAPRNIPHMPTSIMDGFALKACDEKREYEVAQEIHANKDAVTPCGEHKAVYITTGGILPEGADAVVPVEDADEVSEDKVILPKCQRGQHIRQIGSDTKEGEVILPKHTLLTAGDIGVLAACGVSRVKCFRQPRVAVLSTGDELHDITNEGDIGNGIFDANRPLLKALVREEHCEVVDYGIIDDDPKNLRALILTAGRECDVVILSGGVSRGNKDYAKPILEDIGTVHFGSMNMKPGKPTTFATLNGSSTLLFGLPGNPASCFVTFKLLLVPALRKLRGMERGLTIPKVRITTLTPLQPDPTRPEYVRAAAFWSNGKLCAESRGFQRSSRAQSCALSNCFILVPPLSSPPDPTASGKCRCSVESPLGKGALAAGTELDGYLFGPINDPPEVVTTSASKAASGVRPEATAKESSPLNGIEKKSLRSAEQHINAETKVAEVHPAQAHVHHHAAASGGKGLSCGLLTVSDRAAQGAYEDKTGPACRKAIEEIGWQVTRQEIVSDSEEDIRRVVSNWAAEGVQVILTMGGTGFAPRDITPEAITPLLTKQAPGLTFAIMQEGIKHTPFALLSRPVCGVIRSSVVCTLPGSPKGAVEGITALKMLLPHATHLLFAPSADLGALGAIPTPRAVLSAQARQDRVWLTHEPIDPLAVCDLVRRAECGAMVTFDGMTRNNFEGKEVINLAYEAYEPMALNILKQIKAKAETRFPDTCCAIVHRLGNVPVKESSLLIAVSSPHRAEAFDCGRFVLEEVKSLVPVWKKEEYREGDAAWKENAEWKPPTQA